MSPVTSGLGAPLAGPACMSPVTSDLRAPLAGPACMSPVTSGLKAPLTGPACMSPVTSDLRAPLAGPACMSSVPSNLMTPLAARCHEGLRDSPVELDRLDEVDGRLDAEDVEAPLHVRHAAEDVAREDDRLR